MSHEGVLEEHNNEMSHNHRGQRNSLGRGDDYQGGMNNSELGKVKRAAAQVAMEWRPGDGGDKGGCSGERV